MSFGYDKCGCWPIEKFSFRYQYFALIDTADHLADQLFIKHKVPVWFGEEYFRADTPFRVIVCRCRKRDIVAFMMAISELTNKMLLCGHLDYPAFCEGLKQRIIDSRNTGGDHNETVYTAEKAEQESAKRTSCQTAR